jgi:endonuclease/exonuclease/phosphatase family metal-dependent hydrolase
MAMVLLAVGCRPGDSPDVYSDVTQDTAQDTASEVDAADATLGDTEQDAADSADSDASPPLQGCAADPTGCGHYELETFLADGRLGDWPASWTIYQDPQGDAGPSKIDFTTLAAAHDDRYLYLRIDIGHERNLQSGNDILLYLDTDGDAATGASVLGLGAELMWNFGDREGTYYGDAGTVPVDHEAIEFRSAPTVTASEFEVVIGLDVRPDGGPLLFSGDTVRVALRDGFGGAGDSLPEEGESAVYSFTSAPVETAATIPLERSGQGELRLVTWNMLDGGLMKPQRQPAFRRLLKALDPDVVAFQEAWSVAPDDVVALFDAWLPQGGHWVVRKSGSTLTASRHAIPTQWPGHPLDNVMATLITPPDREPFVLLNAHFSCCSAEEDRQAQADGVVAFLADARSPGGKLELPEGTAVVLAGDLNLVGLRAPLDTLLTGKIWDTDTFGEPSAPDWDGTDLLDLISRHNARRTTFTYRTDDGAFTPGRLDFIIYTDSVVDVARHFVLDTRELPSDLLSAHDLEFDDSPSASDHLPHVADLLLP